MFHFFEKVNKEHLKLVNVEYKNSQLSLYYHFNEILKKPKTSF